MKNAIAALVSIIVLLMILVPVWFGCTPAGKAIWNKWFYSVQKADDATNYETIKKVEDTCRSMMASYESDKLTYEQYKDSDNEEKQSWAEQARMRANKTVASYNEYILKNTFVWSGNIPSDIKSELEYIIDE